MWWLKMFLFFAATTAGLLVAAAAAAGGGLQPADAMWLSVGAVACVGAAYCIPCRE